MPNHYRIKVEFWNDKAPSDVTVMGEINATETGDSNPAYSDFACWISKWGRPNTPLYRGSVAFDMNRNSWELVYEMLKAFVMPIREQEVEEREFREKALKEIEAKGGRVKK